MADLLVKRSDLRESRIAESDPPEIAPGEALLRVERFGLTANNVTYAVFGEAMSYWRFFPAEEGWGRVPMWGFAEVEHREAADLEAGARVYGYLPPSSHLVVTPAGADAHGFDDGRPIAPALPSVYQRYVATDSDPFYRADTEAVQMLLRPLFFTSFLIDDPLADEGLTERGPVLHLQRVEQDRDRRGVPAARRERGRVRGTHLSSQRRVRGRSGDLRPHGHLRLRRSLERGPATFVDVAGDGEVRFAVHSHFGDELMHSMAVGATHWEGFGAGAEELPGPSPALFFAPDRVTKRTGDWGGAGLNEKVADAWHPFCAWAGGWLKVLRGQGMEAVQSAWLEVLEGRVRPHAAHVGLPVEVADAARAPDHQIVGAVGGVDPDLVAVGVDGGGREDDLRPHHHPHAGVGVVGHLVGTLGARREKHDVSGSRQLLALRCAQRRPASSTSNHSSSPSS